MRAKLILWVMGSVLTMAACDNSSNTSSSAPVSAAQATTHHAPTVHELKSSDGKVIVQTTQTFVDKMTDAQWLPEGIEKDKVVLLQRNEDSEITLYAVHAGETQQAADYFAKVKTAIEQDKTLQNANVGEASANMMSYAFSQVDAQGNVTLNEQCHLMVENKQIYTICANGADSSQADLAAILQNVSVVK